MKFHTKLIFRIEYKVNEESTLFSALNMIRKSLKQSNVATFVKQNQNDNLCILGLCFLIACHFFFSFSLPRRIHSPSAAW